MLLPELLCVRYSCVCALCTQLEVFGMMCLLCAASPLTRCILLAPWFLPIRPSPPLLPPPACSPVHPSISERPDTATPPAPGIAAPGRLHHNRTLFLFGKVGEKMSTETVANLLYLDSLSSEVYEEKERERETETVRQRVCVCVMVDIGVVYSLLVVALHLTV